MFLQHFLLKSYKVSSQRVGAITRTCDLGRHWLLCDGDATTTPRCLHLSQAIHCLQGSGMLRSSRRNPPGS
jgi:hypothetical protein